MNAPTKNLPALYSMTDLEKMAAQMVKSKLFGVANVEQAVTLMLVAQAENLHPATAARDYHIIQGRPSMKADTMMSRFQASGGIVEWQDYTDSKVSATFKHPQSPKPVLIEWTFEMATKVGLTGRDNWRNYPRAMLRARVISEGVRTCYPVVSPGIYAPEEVEHFHEERNITPTAGYFKALPGKRQDIISETAVQIREHMDNDRPLDALGLVEDPALDAEEQIALWSLLPSDNRSALKALQAAERARTAGTISPGQKKRLEARIGELGLEREAVKRHCADRYGVSTFTALTGDQYQELDAALDGLVGKTNESAGLKDYDRKAEHTGVVVTAAPSSPADLITEDEAIALDAACSDNGINVASLKKAAGVDRLAMIKAADLPRAKAWVAAAIEKRKDTA